MTHEESNRSNQLYVAKEALRIRRDKVSRRQATDMDMIDGEGAVTVTVTVTVTGGGTGGGTAAGDNEMDSDSPGPDSGSERIIEQFKQVLNDNAENVDFFGKIQRLLGKKCDIAEHEVSLMKNESDGLKRRIRGYENYLNKDHGHGHGHGVGVGAMQMQE